MSEQNSVPASDQGTRRERKRLAPKPAQAFKAFSQSVFADGALPRRPSS